MGSIVSIIGTLVYFLNEWISSYSNKQKYHESSLSLIALVITVVFTVIFGSIVVLHVFESNGWHFWMALAVPLLLIIQFIGNVKSYFRSKRNERVIINTINHTMNTQYTKEFTVKQLMNDTGVDEFYEVEQIFTNAKRNGNIPHTAILKNIKKDSVS